jgi:hypothetical protein
LNTIEDDKHLPQADNQAIPPEAPPKEAETLKESESPKESERFSRNPNELTKPNLCGFAVK